MKALVISDDVKTLEFVDDILSKNGMDIINYKWLVKALDNIEEINPDLIVINVLDYPRHWKTLTQFVKTIFLNKISICLFVPEGFSGGEMKKARTLEIDFCCHSQEEFEKCIHNFTQTKKTFLQNLKKIYSEKDDSSIISVTDLLQLLGTTFVNKSDDVKLHSALELCNKLEEISKKSENAETSEKSQPIEQSETTENPKNAVAVDEQKNGAVESEREIKNDESVAIVPTATETTDTTEDDYVLPTVENLLESSSEECVLPTAANLFDGENFTESKQAETIEHAEEKVTPATDETANEADDYTLPTESEQAETIEHAEEEVTPATDETANDADDCTLPTVENIVSETEVESAVDTSSETPFENGCNESLEAKTNDPTEKSDDYVLPTVENLLESSSEECVLPTAANLFAGENFTESEQAETVEHAEEKVTPATDETANDADDYTLPTAENIVAEAEVEAAVDTTSETPIENECNESLEAKSDDYVLPTVENLLESSSEECVLPTAANLFAGENFTESEQAETVEHAEEKVTPATDETANDADDYTLPTAENIVAEAEVEAAVDTTSETPIENECDEPLEAKINAPSEKSDDYVLPTVENLLESSSEECVLPTAANLFAGVKATESEQAETVEHAEEKVTPATDETANEADDCTLPTESEQAETIEHAEEEVTSATDETANEADDCSLSTESEQAETVEHAEEKVTSATDVTANDADDCTLPTAENIVSETEVESAVDTSSETPIENGCEEPLEAKINAPSEKSDEPEADAVSSADSKKHFGSLFRLIQEKYESE